MIQILLLKLVFFVFAVLVCINMVELLPHQMLSLDFFTQFSLLIICIGLFTGLKRPSETQNQLQTSKQDQRHLSQITYAPSLLMCKVGIGAFVAIYCIRLFTLS